MAKNLWKKYPDYFRTGKRGLFDAIDYVEKTGQYTEAPEVALAIIRILESLKQQKDVSWEQAQAILKEKGLNNYLAVWNS